MTPTIVFLDCETTGPGRPDPLEDRIVELCLQPQAGQELSGLIHPGEDFLPIPEGRTEVHGITTEDVEGLPTFEDIADVVQETLETADYLCGYGIRRYDTPLLDAELRRHGQPGLDLASVREVDLYRVWCEEEPRTLEGAVERFGVRNEHDAHTASGDVLVLPELLARMIFAFDPDYVDEWEAIGRMADLSRPDHEVDRAGKFRREDGEVVFAFGKHRGEPASEHTSYLDWMLGADFSGATKRWCRRLIKESETIPEPEPTP